MHIWARSEQSNEARMPRSHVSLTLAFWLSHDPNSREKLIICNFLYFTFLNGGYSTCFDKSSLCWRGWYFGCRKDKGCLGEENFISRRCTEAPTREWAGSDCCYRFCGLAGTSVMQFQEYLVFKCTLFLFSTFATFCALSVPRELCLIVSWWIVGTICWYEKNYSQKHLREECIVVMYVEFDREDYSLGCKLYLG